eukprot:Phypoly_transcript_07884.p1 GENE.Phypoly_transcript_07884~~Phypoly_transcript_07884.p1  ORF type:complete len:388 (+),score=86.05 Phypoly_transcript_07884:46-1209(+)
MWCAGTRGVLVRPLQGFGVVRHFATIKGSKIQTSHIRAKNTPNLKSGKTNTQKTLGSIPKSDQIAMKSSINTHQLNNTATNKLETKPKSTTHKNSPANVTKNQTTIGQTTIRQTTKGQTTKEQTTKGQTTKGQTTKRQPTNSQTAKGKPTKEQITKVKPTKNKTTKLAPQVADLEKKERKEIPTKEAVIRGEKINEVHVKGELVKEESIERTGEVVKEENHWNTIGGAGKRKGTKERPGELVRGEKISEGVEVQGEVVKEEAMDRVGQVVKGDATSLRPMEYIVNEVTGNMKYKDEDDVDDPELAGYGEETYNYFTKNVAELGKGAYLHYVKKIKQFLEYEQQYFAVRLFTFMQKSMKLMPDLYEIMILNFLEKGRFTNAYPLLGGR